MLIAMVMWRALLLGAASCLLVADGLLTETVASGKAKSVVRHEQKVEINGQGGFHLQRGAVPIGSYAAGFIERTLATGSSEVGDLSVAVGMQARHLGTTGEHQLMRHEDVFHTLKREKVQQGKPSLAEMHHYREEHEEYNNVKQDRKQICVPSALGGKALTQDRKFHTQTMQGRKAMSSKSIIFAGLVRDIGDSASKLFATLRVLGESFANYHIIVLENNSNDGGHTHHGLQLECAGSETWCFMIDIENMRRFAQSQKQPKRVKHLTELRQMLLNQVRAFASTTPQHWDFVLMFDGDIFANSREGGTSQGFHLSMLDALFGLSTSHQKVIADDPLDLVCANQMANWPNPGRYRDTFALRIHSWNESQKGPGDKDLYLSGNLLLPMKSCFSGLALYAMRAISAPCNYTYTNEDTCEHVNFHHCLSEKGHDQVAIYPPLAVRTYDEGIPEEHCELLLADDEVFKTRETAGRENSTHAESTDGHVERSNTTHSQSQHR